MCYGMPRADKIRFTGTFPSRDEAAGSLSEPGDIALVHRGVPRLLLMRCPCRCGDILVINLDPRSGPAWRMYQRRGGISLHPSYWRDTHCESHFVLWSNCIYWCDGRDDNLWSRSSEIEERVLQAMPEHYVNYHNLADALDEIPWDVLMACHGLVRRGVAEMKQPRQAGEFRRRRMQSVT